MTGHPILDTLTAFLEAGVRMVLLAVLAFVVYAVAVYLPAEMRAVAEREAAREIRRAGRAGRS